MSWLLLDLWPMWAGDSSHHTHRRKHKHSETHLESSLQSKTVHTTHWSTNTEGSSHHTSKTKHRYTRHTNCAIYKSTVNATQGKQSKAKHYTLHFRICGWIDSCKYIDSSHHMTTQHHRPISLFDITQALLKHIAWSSNWKSRSPHI